MMGKHKAPAAMAGICRSALVWLLLTVGILMLAAGAFFASLTAKAETRTDEAAVYDYYDMTGRPADNYLPTGTLASEIGSLPSNENVAMRMKLVLPSPLSEEIQFGAFAPEGAETIWGSPSLIVGFSDGLVRLSLMDSTQDVNPVQKASAQVADIRAGSQITFELGSKKYYENDEYTANYIYISVNGEEVIGWQDTAKTALGTRFLSPYFTSGTVALKTAYGAAPSATDDFYDVTGAAETLCDRANIYLESIGDLSANIDIAFKTNITMPATLDPAGMQLGVFNGGANVWDGASLILRIRQGYIGLLYSNETLLSECINVPEVATLSTFELEVGIVRGIDRSENHFGNIIYVKVNGNEVLSYTDVNKTEFGTKVMYPYQGVAPNIVMSTTNADEREAVQTEDIYDVTGNTENAYTKIGDYSTVIGNFSANSNIAFKANVTLPASFNEEGVKFGIFNSGENIWDGSGRIVRFAPGIVILSNADEQILSSQAGVDAISAGNTFEMEIGYAKSTLGGQSYNVTYIKIDGTEVVRDFAPADEALGTKLFHPYLVAGSPSLAFNTTYTVEMEDAQTVQDIHDLTGMAKNTYTDIGVLSAVIGNFKTNSSVAFKANVTLPASFNEVGVKIGIFSSGEDNMWKGKGRIVRFAPGTLLLSDQTDANWTTVSVPALTAGNTFLFEIGYVPATFAGESYAATYVKIDGEQVALYLSDASEELGTKLFYPYLDAGNPSLTFETTKTVGTLNFQAANGTVSGLEFVSGSPATVTVTPDQGAVLQGITKNGEPFNDYTLENGSYKIVIAEPNADDQWRAEFVFPTRDEAAVSDLSDMTGMAENYFYTAADSTQIGTLPWLNTAFRANMSLSLTNEYQAMKFGIWQGEDRVQMWGTKGFIVRFNPNDGTIQLADAGEALLATASAADIFDGEEFLFEMGAVKGYVGGEYVCNVVYIKIDGAEVLSYVDAEMKEHGDALLAPYMTAGSAALYKTSLQAKSFTVNAQNAAVIGNSFVEGGSGAVVYLKPTNGYMLASILRNGEAVTGFTSTADGMVILTVADPAETDVYEAVFAQRALDEVKVYDLYDMTGHTEYSFTRPANSWDLGNVPWLNTAFKTKITIGENTPSVKFAAFIQTYDRLYMWGSHAGTTGLIVRLGGGTVVLANDAEAALATGSSAAVVSGGTFTLEIGAKKAYAGDDWVANYIYISIDGTEVLHYIDYTKAERGTIIMTPYLDNAEDMASFTTSYTESELTFDTQNAEGILLEEGIPAFADRAFVLEIPMEKGYAITGATLNGADVMQYLTEIKGYGYLLTIEGGIPGGSTLAFTTAEASYDIAITSPEHAAASADKGDTVLKNDSVVFTLKPEEGYIVTSAALGGADVTALLKREGGVWTLTVDAADGALSLSYTVEAASYTVNVPQGTNGSVTADKASVPAGGSVTLTVKPDEGYYVKELKINGETVRVNSDGTYTVSGVYENINAEVSFEAIPETGAAPEAGGLEWYWILLIVVGGIVVAGGIAVSVIFIVKKRGASK